MNVEFKAIRDAGVLEKERVVLTVIEPTDIGGFLVCKVEPGERPGGISNKILQSFWFPDQKVKAGDLVVMYSKAGDDKKKKNSNGTTTYFFYWDLQKPTWHDQSAAIVIMHSDSWDYEFLSTADDSEEQASAVDST